MDQHYASVSTVCAITVATGILGVCGYGLFAPNSHFFAPVTCRGSAERRRVALTFDDGPVPGSTDVILDHLNNFGAKATFFVIGRYALQFPDLLKRIHDEGHSIGNHTFDHHRHGLLRGVRYWTDQVARTDDAIAAVVGANPKYFRPPFGFKCPPLARAVRDKSIIAWSRRGYDGIATSADRILKRLDGIDPGDIILLHDGREPASHRDLSATSQALPPLLELLKARDLAPVTIDDVLKP